MKALFLSIMTCIALFCVSCSSLTSVTMIEPNKAFVLGENKHLGYSASIKNLSTSPIEVLLTSNNKTNSLGLLQPNKSQIYKVASNSTVAFKNTTNTQAKIGIKIIGDTNLSMGYK